MSAGWLWTTSGYIITSYSTEATRGKFIAVQGVLAAMGSVVGSALTFGIVDGLPSTTTSTSVPTAVYACFTALMITSPFVAALLLIDPSKIRRADGEPVAVFRTTKTTTVKREFLDALKNFKDWKLLLMLPVFFACDVATVSPSMNAYAFDLKARTLLAFVTTLAGIPTVLCLWPLLDNPRWPRKVRGLCAVSFLGLLVIGAWGGLLGWMKGKPVNDRFVAGPSYSWHDDAFAGFCVVVRIMLSFCNVGCCQVTDLSFSIAVLPVRSRLRHLSVLGRLQLLQSAKCDADDGPALLCSQTDRLCSGSCRPSPTRRPSLLARSGS